MTHKVGPKGQVVIPKEMRDALGIRPGDRVDFFFDGNAITIEPIHASTSLMGTLAGAHLTQALEADRRSEVRRERQRRTAVPA